MRNPLAPALFALFLVLPALLPAAGRPIAHEDVWLMKRVGAPVPSPDGRWIVFSGNFHSPRDASGRAVTHAYAVEIARSVTAK